MSTAPALIPLTTPEELTVATAGFDDSHDACDVTVCTLPVDIVAEAANCARAPTSGATPETLTAVTVAAAGVGVVVEREAEPLSEHAHPMTASRTVLAKDTTTRRMPTPLARFARRHRERSN